MKLYLFIFATYVVTVQGGGCPNQCSGNGTCGSSSVCTCHPNFTGPDCSLRECKFDFSWTAEGTGTVPAGNGLGGQHAYTECSSKGICNRSTGECECFPGYEGQGCARQSCPNDCSGHGSCLLDYEVTGVIPSMHHVYTSAMWSANKSRQCACDRGWQGADCSERMCPYGDDPITDCGTGPIGNDHSAAHNMIQRLVVATTTVGGKCSDPSYTTRAACEGAGTCSAGYCSAGHCSLGTCVETCDTTTGICLQADGTDSGDAKGDCAAGNVWIPTDITQAMCEAAGGTWGSEATTTALATCITDKRYFINTHNSPHECVDYGGTWTSAHFNDGTNPLDSTDCATALAVFHNVELMACTDSTSATKPLCTTAGYEWEPAYTTSTTCTAASGTWTSDSNTWLTARGTEDSAADACAANTTSYPRLDQSLGYCSVAGLMTEAACNAASATWTVNECALGLKFTGDCYDGVSDISAHYNKADCVAASNTWKEGRCDTTTGIGTNHSGHFTETDCTGAGGTWTPYRTLDENVTTASDDLFGYIALKFTDKYQGQYYTRPILIDVSAAATQDSKAASNQYDGGNYYISTSSRNGNARSSDAGQCTGHSNVTTRENCEALGFTWSPNNAGFYLTAELANDSVRASHLKRYTADRIRYALQDLPNFAIPQVNVTNYKDTTSNTYWGNVFDITFTDSGTAGKQELLECVYGSQHSCDGAQPKLMSWSDSTDQVAHSVVDNNGSTNIFSCTVMEVVQSGKTYAESAPCSNRGLCNTSDGTCECFQGHTGEACSIQTVFY